MLGNRCTTKMRPLRLSLSAVKLVFSKLYWPKCYGNKAEQSEIWMKILDTEHTIAPTCNPPWEGVAQCKTCEMRQTCPA